MAISCPSALLSAHMITSGRGAKLSKRGIVPVYPACDPPWEPGR